MIISHSRLRFLPRSKIIHSWLLHTATSLLYPQFYTYPPYCLRCKQTQQEVPFLTWEEDVIYLFLQYICQHVFQFLCSSQARYKQKLNLCGLKDFCGDIWLNDPQEWPPGWLRKLLPDQHSYRLFWFRRLLCDWIFSRTSHRPQCSSL